MVQVAAGARVVQFVVLLKLGVAVVGVAIWRVAELVLVRVMVCWVEVGPGALLKMRAVGFRARPGSGEPKPVSGAAAALVVVVWRVRRPLRWPLAVGGKVIWRKQEAAGARGPVQGMPLPVSEKGAGVPEVLEVRVRVAVWGPVCVGVNWTPSQQLAQVLV